MPIKTQEEEAVKDRLLVFVLGNLIKSYRLVVKVNQMLEFSLFFMSRRISCQPHFSYICNALSSCELPVQRSSCAYAESTLSERLIRSFTEHLLSFLFTASSWPRFHSTVSDRSFTQYMLRKSPSSWSVTRPLFLRISNSAGNKSSLNTVLLFLPIEYYLTKRLHVQVFKISRHNTLSEMCSKL